MPKLSCFGTVPGQPLSLEKFHNKMHVGFDRALPPPNKMKFCIETWWAQCMSIFSGAGTADHFFSGEVYWPSLDSAEARQRIIKDQSALIEVGGTKLEFRQYCNDVETPAIKSLDYAKAQSEQRNAQWKIDHPNGWKPEGHRERGDGGGYDPGDDGRSQADDQGSGDGSSGAASSIQDPDAVIKAITDKINGQKPSNNPGAAVSPVKPAPPRVSSQGIAQPGSSGSSVIAAPAGNGAGANSAPAQVKLRPVAPKPQAPRAQKSSGSSEPLLPPI